MLEKILVVNGFERKLVVDPDAFLSDVLRDQLHLIGTKVGCGKGQCGACSVIIDGKVVRACITKIRRLADYASVTTIEGLGNQANLHPLQIAWVAHGAAQCGFCTPGFILSAKALLDENPKPTREQVRDWFQKHKNVCRCTGFIPLVDAVMDAAKVLRGEMTLDINHNMPADGNIFGSRAPRPSGVAKVMGQWLFGDDQKLMLPPGTLHLAIVEARVSHANIKGVDYAEALTMPGVHSVITAKDVKGKNRITGLITFPTNKGDGWDRPILCDTKVFQYGDAIALVAADSEANARAAAEKVKVDLEVLPAYMSAPAAMAEDAIEIHPGTPNAYYEQNHAKGADVAPFFSDPSKYEVMGGDYYTQRQPHLPIEPDVGYAFYDEDGILRIYSKSIGLYLHLYMIAPGLGVEPDKIALIQLPTGGTFGYKFSPTMEALVGAATMATGRPCHLHYNYAQQQYYTGKRSPFWTKGKIAVDKATKKIVASEMEWIVDHGPYSEFGDLLTLRGSQYWMAGYGIPNMRAKGYCVATNHGWGSAFRGYGSPEIMFPSECLMDEMAEKLGMDPLEFRYVNVYRPGDTTPTDQVPDSWTLPEMIEILRPKYTEAMANAKKNSTATHKKGVGVAIGIYGSGLDGPDSAGADAELNPDGTVTVFNTWQDHGQGSDAGTLGFAHETLKPLGLKACQIKLVLNDTSKCPNSGPAGGSRSNVVVGNAIINGCKQLVDAMRKPDGTFRTYDEMVKEGIKTKYNGAWTAPAKDCDANGLGSPFCCYMYGLFMAEVTVELATGKTQVDKMTLVEDIGTINNRQTVDGQNWGGLAQGIGLALSEDFEDIKKHSSLAGAGVPYIHDIPDAMELIYVESPREHGPYGNSGVGEVPLCGPHPAIINAIYNACGVRIRHLPAYPEKVLAGLKALGK
ncbi:molybdopterin-dependent aldehyde oxidoreductase [Solidesulfovibrio sp.]|uniref:molybdopterin-dependent aldehyde oxidoreductase n=1 Tax=Solidesulfovibrio sp. TaxID=2910990 RepID=UPI002B1FC9CE|nr:molybdopterin-dependent aldehyde oxidoreductase [Solidesulfovibrio sp.]MEA4855194.1 molybdopterin cofactor-binding domain-containing protein [Solidesulfovibrio sp.]